MIFRFRLTSAMLAFFSTPVVDVIDPPAPVDDLQDVMRRHGISEIHKATEDNLLHFTSARSLPPSPSGYGFTFRKKG